MTTPRIQWVAGRIQVVALTHAGKILRLDPLLDDLTGRIPQRPSRVAEHRVHRDRSIWLPRPTLILLNPHHDVRGVLLGQQFGRGCVRECCGVCPGVPGKSTDDDGHH
jgi:hypothetical protein